MTVPLSLLLAHFIGDFVCQTDGMAKNKSTSWLWLSLHAAVYAFVLNLWGLWFFELGGAALLFWAITLVTHFLTDAVTSRITSKLWFFKPVKELYSTLGTIRVNGEYYPIFAQVGGNRHYFFVMIGFDQLIHYWTLAWTLKIVTVGF